MDEARLLNFQSDSRISRAISSKGLIGWESMLQGMISREWHAAFIKSLATTNPTHTVAQLEKQANHWQTQLICQMWELSKHIWSFRNKVVHGKLDNLTISKELHLLHEKATKHFKNYAADPHYVMASMNNLFNRPLSTILSLDCNTLHCWIEMVQAAVDNRKHREKLDQERGVCGIQNFFLPSTSHHCCTLPNENNPTDKKKAILCKWLEGCQTDQ
jgi:hypothetical protein